MRAVLRSTLFYLGMFIFTILIVLPGLPLAVLSYPLRFKWLSQWSRLTLWWLGVTCGVHYQVVGRENIPPGPAVVLAKHQSTWETLALQQIFPAQTWVLKRELLWIPIFGWGLALTSPVAIDRKSTKRALRQVIDQGTARLRQGIWMVIFPEGTRTAPGERRKYAVGGALLAEKAGVPVVPVAHNAGYFWPKQGFVKRPGTITVTIGAPIATQGVGAAEINRIVEEWIESRVQEIGGG